MLASAAAHRIGSLLLDDALESPAPRERTRSLLAFLFAIFVVFSLHASLGTGSLSTPVIRAEGPLQPVHGDSEMQFKSKFVAMASAVALSVGGSALAADAVQWRVEDGGNGHWYRLANLAAPSAWVQARQHALMMGADLVSIPSAEVQAFVVPLLGAAIVPNGGGGVWIGAYQLSGDPEPGGFRWVSGDVFGYTGPWWSPSNCCSSCPGEVGENYVTISSPADNLRIIG